MTFWFKVLFFIVLTGIVIGAVAILGTSTSLLTQINHIGPFFTMISGNINNFRDILPTVDILLAFGAVLTIEGIIIVFKIYKYFVNLGKSNN